MDLAFQLYTAVIPVDKNKLTHQMFIFWLILSTGGIFFYLLFASLSYFFFFKKAK